MRNSMYWDDFNRRISETVEHVKFGSPLPIRRVAVFITDKCNFRCAYCNSGHNGKTMSKNTFLNIIKKYGDTAIIHITGGEPSVVPWLYPLISEIGESYRFHLNTNAFIAPPAKHVKRLKISLDSTDQNSWDKVVGKNGAFQRVVENIKNASKETVASLTYTLTRRNYWQAIEFAKMCSGSFPKLYAIFFSIYKGADPYFAMTNKDVDTFFCEVLPRLSPELNDESRHLLAETIDEKRRLLQGVRFKQNGIGGACYISMSERVFSPDGNEYTCSHQYRDGVFNTEPVKTNECKYGCNRRLVRFNEVVEEKIFSEEAGGQDD